MEGCEVQVGGPGVLIWLWWDSCGVMQADVAPIKAPATSVLPQGLDCLPSCIILSERVGRISARLAQY
jgi:hypothetical protein